ncbi:hypothetical protein TrRE_jg8300 [Triparma retinervis]|uniref:NACHT domain-containing protein n=1 Tax=Triparma retinervis TaxID=2557542 RepID=A0A9W7AEV9_9STRA|nr:hypothetical protein TrRE_jg8300 [Triparma retinervis]
MREGNTRLHPQHEFLYGVDKKGGYLDKKRGKRGGENRGGVNEYRFAGRKWLFEEVKKWMNKEGGKQMMVLLASAGFGKSAFAAQLVEEEMKDDVIAFHFCSNEQTSNLNPRKFIDGLVVSFANNVEGFTAKLLELVEFQIQTDQEDEPLLDQDSLDHFSKFVDDKKKEPQDIIQDYVLEALSCVKGPAKGKVKLIVVDSLDEAALVKDEKMNILDLVAKMVESDKLPDWVKLLVTSRHQTNVTSKLNSTKRVDLRIKLEGEHKKNNEKDMSEYLTGYFTPGKNIVLQAFEIMKLNNWRIPPTDIDYINAIVEASDGMFLYVVYMVDDINAGRLSLDELFKKNICYDIHQMYKHEFEATVNDMAEYVDQIKKHSPIGIYEVYKNRFEATFNDMGEYAEKIRPLLEIIAGAKCPIPNDILQRVSGLNDAVLRNALEQVMAFCKDCGEEDNETFTFVHPTFADWILNVDGEKDYKKFMVSKEKGEEAITKALLAKGWNSKSEYFGRQGRAHLGDAVKEWLDNAEEAKKKYGHISDWDVSEVTDFINLFKGARNFNEDLSSR